MLPTPITELHHGDALTILRSLPAASVDAVVTDPPCGIGFLGREWDSDKGGRRQWVAWMTGILAECLRVLKPGGHAFVWALPRTSHWTAWAVEDAGFEVRDVCVHLFGTGFPKSLDVSKAIDKAVGAERTEVEQHWQGWGTALKPGGEHWILARKPLSEKTVAANVLRWGTGGINIDAGRVGYRSEQDRTEAIPHGRTTSKRTGVAAVPKISNGDQRVEYIHTQNQQGRWPANVILSPEAAEEVDRQSGQSKSRAQGRPSVGQAKTKGITYGGGVNAGIWHEDTGGASRFFYVAKPSPAERNRGCEMLEALPPTVCHALAAGLQVSSSKNPSANTHPTVKPLALMRHLVGLVTPPGGIVLDPFLGSGTTGVAAKQGGFGFIGVEQDAGYLDIARARIDA